VSIPDYCRTNFHTMLRAAADGQLALMQCTDAVTGEPVMVVCMVNATDDESGDVEMVPVAHMFAGNPYDGLLPPI
jgi:hypothetical protein